MQMTALQLTHFQQNAIAKLTPKLDKRCKDSSDALRKRLVDSLVVVREREIIMQTLPPNH